MTITVFSAKKIITMNPARPNTTHVAIRDGRVLGSGSLEELAGWGEYTLDETFKDKVIMPGLVEGHSHAMEGTLWKYTYVGFFDRMDPNGHLWDGLKGIEELESVLHKKTKKYFLFGNHEDRYFRALKTRDNAKYGAALKNPVTALDLIAKGWEVKTDWKEDYFNITPDLIVLHGKYCGQNPATAHAKNLPMSNIFGHTHRWGSYNFHGKKSYNIGGLYDKESKFFKYVDWVTRLNWENGFCIVDVLPDKTYFVNMVECKNDSFIVDGVIY